MINKYTDGYSILPKSMFNDNCFSTLSCIQFMVFSYIRKDRYNERHCIKDTFFFSDIKEKVFFDDQTILGV